MLLLDIAQQTTLGGWVVKLLLNALALVVASRLLGGVRLNSFGDAVFVAALLTILNATITHS